VAKFYGLLCLASGRPAGERHGDPQLHLNLWEQVDQVSLDIGLMVGRDFYAKEIYFYLPWAREREALIDLTPRINDADAIAAIFNESWQVTRLPRSSSATVRDPNSGNVLFQVISPANYLETEEETQESHRIKLDFGKLVRTERLEAEQIYLRFRIKGIPRAFYAVGFSQGDQGLVSSWTKDEFIDFRLNVRRGAPPDLETHVGHYLSFSKVHLFLMRHRSNELIFQDSAFRSCRSLEDEHFWAKYSHNADSPTAQELADTRSHVVNSLGYQWTKRMIQEAPVHEFGILARFKRIELSIKKFLFYAVLIGAAGNALWTLITCLFSLAVQ
jgi:hypothetical protein